MTEGMFRNGSNGIEVYEKIINSQNNFYELPPNTCKLSTSLHKNRTLGI